MRRPPSCTKKNSSGIHRIKDRLRLITVKYFSFDGRIHQGQLVIDIDLIDDIVFAFEEALKEGFQIYSVYYPEVKGALTNDSVIVKSLLSRGWVWGGNWTDFKDYQHLEKRR